jgi:hypothetical protein
MSLFNISKLVCNNSYKEHQCFLYHANLGSFCIIIDEEEKFQNISKTTMLNFFNYAEELNIKFIFLFINQKNKDILKITQTAMIMGFEKENILNCTVLDDGNTYSIFKISLEKNKENIDEVEDIDF